MTLQEFTETGHKDNMDFVGANKKGVKFGISDDKKSIIFVVSDGVKTAKYRPQTYLKYLVSYFVFKADEEPDEAKQLKILCSIKADVIVITEEIKRMIDENPGCNNYELSGHIIECDAYIEMAQAKLQSKLLNSQIATNASNIDANRISTRTNRNIAVFTFIAALYYGFELVKDYFPETEMHKRTFENWMLIALFVLGILGFLKINLRKQQINRTDRP